MKNEEKWSESRSVVSNPLWPHRLYSPRNYLGQNIGVGSLFFLQGIFQTQGSNPGLPHCRWILYQLSHKEAHGDESWTIMKAERQRIEVFKLWCWKWCLRIPWTERRSNQSILKEINLEYSLEGLKLKLKLQYFDPLMWRANSPKKILMLGKIEDKR